MHLTPPPVQPGLLCVFFLCVPVRLNPRQSIVPILTERDSQMGVSSSLALSPLYSFSRSLSLLMQLSKAESRPESLPRDFAILSSSAAGALWRFSREINEALRHPAFQKSMSNNFEG
jgi:hypothetical protein